MLPYILKFVRLGTVITIFYMFFQSLYHSIWGTEYTTEVFTFVDALWISLLTVVLRYAFIDSATLAGVLRLNIGSFTIALRKDITKPLILYDNEWNVECLKIREACSSLGIPLLIYPVPSLSSNLSYYHHYPLESRFIADAIVLHPKLQFSIPILVDPNTNAIVHGSGEHINNYIYVNYSKRLTDVDPPPPLTIGPLDNATSFLSTMLRKGTYLGFTARPSVYNKLPLHFYGNQADGPSRVVREWLCRLQLSYILYPTSRGSIYRAVLQHQIHSVFVQQRSKLIFERFNILVLYENQKKRILEEMTEEDLVTADNNSIFNRVFDATNNALPDNNGSNPSGRNVYHPAGTIYGPLPHVPDNNMTDLDPSTNSNTEMQYNEMNSHPQTNSTSTPAKRQIRSNNTSNAAPSLGTHLNRSHPSTSHQQPSTYHTLVLQDPITSQFTLMKDQGTQLRVQGDTFYDRLEQLGYELDSPSNSSPYSGNNDQNDQRLKNGDKNNIFDKQTLLHQSHALQHSPRSRSTKHSPTSTPQKTQPLQQISANKTTIAGSSLSTPTHEPLELSNVLYALDIPRASMLFHGNTEALVDDADPIPETSVNFRTHQAAMIEESIKRDLLPSDDDCDDDDHNGDDDSDNDNDDDDDDGDDDDENDDNDDDGNSITNSNNKVNNHHLQYSNKKLSTAPNNTNNDSLQCDSKMYPQSNSKRMKNEEKQDKNDLSFKNNKKVVEKIHIGVKRSNQSEYDRYTDTCINSKPSGYYHCDNAAPSSQQQQELRRTDDFSQYEITKDGKGENKRGVTFTSDTLHGNSHDSFSSSFASHRGNTNQSPSSSSSYNSSPHTPSFQQAGTLLHTADPMNHTNDSIFSFTRRASGASHRDVNIQSHQSTGSSTNNTSRTTMPNLRQDHSFQSSNTLNQHSNFQDQQFSQSHQPNQSKTTSQTKKKFTPQQAHSASTLTPASSTLVQSVDERLLMTSHSIFVRSVGLTMLYDPNTDISCFGETAIVHYIRTMYELHINRTHLTKVIPSAIEHPSEQSAYLLHSQT